jgi:hypothetical protein
VLVDLPQRLPDAVVLAGLGDVLTVRLLPDGQEAEVLRGRAVQVGLIQRDGHDRAVAQPERLVLQFVDRLQPAVGAQ